ncbi:MAG: transglutaminase-like domain-containing protein [Lachnospiraceae bacterium]|nr:transglutaminase-like domain-containing protein [Lachnospiraceae bacterium]
MKETMLQRKSEQKNEQKKHGRTIARFFILFAMVLILACAPSTVMHMPGTLTAQAASSVSKKTVAKKANAIVAKKTKTTDSNNTKLKKLFKYVENNWTYGRAYGFDSSVSNWTLIYAYEAITNKGGSCYHFAAGYAYLARQALGSSTKYKVWIAVGTTNGFGYANQKHAWVEIKMNGTRYVFDPTLDLANMNPDNVFANGIQYTYYKMKRNISSTWKLYYKYKNVEYFEVKYVEVS